MNKQICIICRKPMGNSNHQTGRYFDSKNPSLVEYFFCHVKCESEADKLLPEELRRLKELI